MGKTSIEWATVVWNPVRGCRRVSPGCLNCYAEIMAARFSLKGLWGYGLAKIVKLAGGRIDHRWTGKVVEVEDKLLEPLRWRKPQRVFVNSTSDLFQKGVSDDFIAEIFATMALCQQHTFLILTKRPDRMARFMGDPETQERINVVFRRAAAPYVGFVLARWPLPNVWLGTSIEDQPRCDERLPHLLATNAAHRFISYEPALEKVNFGPALFVGEEGGIDFSFTPRQMVDQIIVGGESGPGSRRFDMENAEAVVDICARAGTAAFVKQMGSKPHRDGKPVKLADKKGGDMTEWPAKLRVRETVPAWRR